MLLKKIIKSIFVGYFLPIVNREIENKTSGFITKEDFEGLILPNELSAQNSKEINILDKLKSDTVPMDLVIATIARSVSNSSDNSVILPHDSTQPNKDPKNIRIGFYGNIANNAYNFIKCLRRLGYNAELIIEDSFFDAFLLNRPFWEDVEVECVSYEDGLQYESEWSQPHYVRRVAYDNELQIKYQGRYSAIQEVKELYKDAFGINLPDDKAFLLAQNMGHWPYLLSMARYDIVQLSGAPISMGIFCPKPYVVFPTGGDLFISPFEENLFGFLMRAGYKSARKLLFCETNYPEYIRRLNVNAECRFAPMMIDTDTYSPGEQENIRKQWCSKNGGRRFILSVCRQSWEWKGNDRLIKAFYKFSCDHPEWRLVIMEWGPDVNKTKVLISQLGIEEKIIWQKLCSKLLLRKYQQVANLVADQFVMEGYGTSVLESLAAGKPVLMNLEKSNNVNEYLAEEPPFIRAKSTEEIYNCLCRIVNETFLEEYSTKGLKWLNKVHGYQEVYVNYVTSYLDALNLNSKGEDI
ncbi:MAG: glycosyltransferase [Bacillota bacterium]|nr:glycosyltransferase [Bacillota bacterium]